MTTQTDILQPSPNQDPSSTTAGDPPLSPARRAARIALWSGAGFFFLLIFTLLKLPEDRIIRYVEGNLQSLLAPRGITYTSSNHVSIGFGVTYVKKDCTITYSPNEPPAHIDKISISPSILGLLTGSVGGTISIVDGNGYLDAKVSVKQTAVYVSFKAKRFDLGRTGLLTALASIKGSGIIGGDGTLSGDFSNPSSISGDIDLNLSKVVVDEQPVFGFSLPRISVSEGKIALATERGKLEIKNATLGKTGSDDDLIANAAGSLTLERTWERSVLDLKAVLRLSQNVLKKLPILDMMLSLGKQPDGSFSYVITGPISAPNPMPAGPSR